jgi:hypothetical protein
LNKKNFGLKKNVGDLMEQKMMSNILYIVAGIIIITTIELKLIHLNELLMLVIGFIGFAALLNGIFGLYTDLKGHKEPE